MAAVNRVAQRRQMAFEILLAARAEKMPDIHGFRRRACPTRKLVAIDGHQFNPRRDKGFGRSTGLSPRFRPDDFVGALPPRIDPSLCAFTITSARIQLGKAALQRGPELASHPLDRLLGAILRLVGELAQHLTNYFAL